MSLSGNNEIAGSGIKTSSYANHNIHEHIIMCMHMTGNVKQQLSKHVDILISKNQVLQILYFKHCVYKTT